MMRRTTFALAFLAMLVGLSASVAAAEYRVGALIVWYLRTAYSQGYADALSYIDRAELRDELQRIDDARPEAA